MGSVILGLAFLLVASGPAGESALEFLGLKESRWQNMCGTITAMVRTHPGDVGVYIKDLKTGKVFEHNANRPFVSASLIKIPVMAATFQAIKEGRFDLDSRIRLSRRNIRWGSGELRKSRVGTSFPVSKLLYEMITESDNTAAAMLINMVGYGYLNQVFDEFGLGMTRVNAMGMSLSSRLDPTQDNYTTPREMAYLLELIYNRELVSDGYSDLMMEIMKNAGHKTRLAKYLPENWKLARKTGLLRKNCHDVGIVFTPNGDYLICVLTGDNKNYSEAKNLIASVGQKAYKYFSPAS